MANSSAGGTTMLGSADHLQLVLETTDSDSQSRIGCDVVVVSEIAASLEAFGDKFLTRVFSARELESCCGPMRDQQLAARFAGKEAVIKVLRPASDAALPLRTIEILRAEWGGCRVVLSGEASALAAAQGIGDIAVSLSHESLVAMGVAFATGLPANRKRT